MRKLLFWVVDCWRVVMDNRYNPLKYIPDPSLQMYFTLVLFVMWSAYFGVLATVYMGFNYNIVLSIAIHIGVVVPIMFTNIIFRDAERNGANWYIDYKAEEGLKKLFPRKNNIVKWDIDKEA